jgi:hypothetical protein
MALKPLREIIEEAFEEMIGIDFSYDDDRVRLTQQVHDAVLRSNIEFVASVLGGSVYHSPDGQAFIQTGFVDENEISDEYWEEYQNEGGDFHEEDDVVEDETDEEVEDDEIEE